MPRYRSITPAAVRGGHRIRVIARHKKEDMLLTVEGTVTGWEGPVDSPTHAKFDPYYAAVPIVDNNWWKVIRLDKVHPDLPVGFSSAGSVVRVGKKTGVSTIVSGVDEPRHLVWLDTVTGSPLTWEEQNQADILFVAGDDD